MKEVLLDYIEPVTATSVRVALNKIRMSGDDIPDVFVFRDEDQLRKWESTGLIMKGFRADVRCDTMAGIPIKVRGQ